MTTLPRTAPAPRALALLVGLAGCGAGLGVGSKAPGIVACRDVCDAELAACPSFDAAGCASICDAYGITIETTTCDDLFKAYNDCLVDQSFSCFDTMAVPEDTEACKAAYDAWTEAC